MRAWQRGLTKRLSQSSIPYSQNLRRKMMKFNKLMPNPMYAAVLVLALSFAVKANPGDLDPTYGPNHDGIVVKTFPRPGGGFWQAYSNGAVLQPDDKTLVVGGGVYSDHGQRKTP